MSAKGQPSAADLPAAARAAEGARQSVPLDAVPAPVALVDRKGALVGANAPFRRLVDDSGLCERTRKDALKAVAADARDGGTARRQIPLGRGRQLTLDARPADTGSGIAAITATLAPDAPGDTPSLWTDLIAWRADARGRLISVSANAPRLLGGPASALVGRPLSDVFRPDGGERLEATAAFAGHQPVRDHRAVGRTPDGQRRWFGLDAQPEFDARGRFTGYAGTARDITSLAQAEADLARLRAECARKDEALARSRAELELALTAARRSEDLKAQFLRNMNHEFHTPLNAIVGQAEMLAMGLRDNGATVREAGACIAAAGRRLSALFDDALAMATIESGETDLALRQVPVSAVINPELAKARERAAADEVDAAGVADAPDACVFADPGLTARIVRALLDNAVKFTPAGGRIGVQVSRSRSGRRLDVAVWDTGGGVDPAVREAIFEPYTRGGGSALVASAAGPGLGLALARAYARLQGGDLVLEKTGRRGSRFKLTLPTPAGRGASSQEI